MATPFELMLAQLLKDYEESLKRTKLGQQSVGNRLVGATEFAMFLVGRTHKTERVRGRLLK